VPGSGEAIRQAFTLIAGSAQNAHDKVRYLWQ
jgi:hypothetical protein